MTTIRNALACLLLAALTVCSWQAFWLLRTATRAAESASSSAAAQIGAARSQLAGQVATLGAQALALLDRRTGDALARVDLATAHANEQLAELNRTTADLAAETSATLGGLRQDLRPTEDAATALLASSDRATREVTTAVHDLHPQLLGLVAASKVTAGETAQTMRDVRNAVPGFLTQWGDISENFRLTTIDFRETAHQSSLASAATARTMANFAAASKPLPTWARIALGVGPPVAQMGAAAASAGALLGWFK